jgi:hypothetical protein
MVREVTMDAGQRERLLRACDAIIDADAGELIGAVIAWPDPATPAGVGTILLPEGRDGEKREAQCNIFLAENEAEARHIHELINAAGPWPLIPMGQ